jgi:hypothetical protein
LGWAVRKESRRSKKIWLVGENGLANEFLIVYTYWFGLTNKLIVEVELGNRFIPKVPEMRKGGFGASV